MKCRKCQFDNTSDSKFCADCGTKLIPAEGPQVSQTMTLETPVEGLRRGTLFAGRYEIIEELGTGGMGSVYRVEDTKIRQEVALKLIRPEIASSRGTIERFRNEIKTARMIGHRNVCRMFDLGEEKGAYFITMEYVPGEDMKSFLKRAAPLSPGRAISIGKQICEGMAEAHRLGVVHRDLKPGNIMIDKEGNARIMDFGIARSIAEKGITGTGIMIGTPKYMSPEQAEGKEADQCSDIYSLGVILFEMVTGRVPFDGETALSIAQKHRYEPVIDPRKINPQVPESVARLILRCLEKDKKKRYETTGEILVDMVTIEEGLPTGERMAPKSKPLPYRGIKVKTTLKKNIVIPGILVAVASVVVIALLLTSVFRGTRRSSENSQASQPKIISVLVANFQNKTGDSTFDGILEKALDITLASSSFISLYNRQDALRMANKLNLNAGGILDQKLAQLISRRAGINVVVGGSVDRSDRGYTIKVWALDTVKSEYIHEYTTAFQNQSEILKVADSISARLRANLGGISDDSIQALTKETFTTASLEAMSAYAHAQELDDQGRPEEALKEYLRAIDHDPNFGRAYSGAALIYFTSNRFDEAEFYFKEAMKRIDQMTDREKYRDRGLYALMQRDYKKAIDEFSALLQHYPGDYVIHANLAIAYFYARNMPAAVKEGLLDIEHNPQGVWTHYNMSWYALATGDIPTAERESRKALELESSFTKAYVTLALTQLAKEQPGEAIATYQKLRELDSFGATLAATGLADLAVYEGRLLDALEILRDGIVFDLKNGQAYDAAMKCTMLAQIYQLQEKKVQAVETAERALKTCQEPEILFSAALIYLNMGHEEKALFLQAELDKKIQPEPRVYGKLIKAELSKARGDLGNSISLFHEANDIIDTWIGRFFLGRAYLQAKDYSAAHSEFEICLKRGGETASVFLNDLPSYGYLPPVHYYLGRALEGLSSEAATDSYNKFLIIKSKDDGADPMVAEARRRLAYLQKGRLERE